jgi:hypothetical protein
VPTPTLQEVTDEGNTTTVQSTFSGGIIANKADTSSGAVNPPSNLVINFTADGSGFYANDTNYSYIIYSYQ